MIDVARSSDAELVRLLGAHPHVAKAELGGESGIEFEQGPWKRSVTVGDPTLETSGLVELIDNNPLVCADRASVPDPVSTLALVGFGPLSLSGIVVEPPSIIASRSCAPGQLDAFLGTAGWQEGTTLHVEERDDLGSVVAVTVMAAIQTPTDWNDIDDLFAERYSRSFYVRRDEDSEWHQDLVAGEPWAAYRLQYTPGEGESLLTVHVIGDIDGKCGRLQLVHAMNVMAGFEESLGVS